MQQSRPSSDSSISSILNVVSDDFKSVISFFKRSESGDENKAKSANPVVRRRNSDGNLKNKDKNKKKGQRNSYSNQQDSISYFEYFIVDKSPSDLSSSPIPDEAFSIRRVI